MMGSGALTNGFARNVSMSSDGTRVAVIYRDGLAIPANSYIVAKGIVIVYEYNANAVAGMQWQQLGTNVIETDTAGDGILASISLSGDGTDSQLGLQHTKNNLMGSRMLVKCDCLNFRFRPLRMMWDGLSCRVVQSRETLRIDLCGDVGVSVARW